LIRELRTRFPIEGRVKVRRHPIKKDCGSTNFDGTDYVIAIDSEQEWGGQVDSLLHEWAHVLAIEASYRHSDEWGVIYARLYNTIDDLPPQPKGDER
jgi:hypothetical protein